MAGHDLNCLAMAGVLDLIGSRGEPVVPGVQIADLTGGSMPAIIATLLALLKRERTGEGQFIDLNITQGSAALLVFPLAYQQATRIPAEPGKGVLGGGYACYNVYRCKDDRWITVAALEGKFWTVLCGEIGRPDLVDDQFADEPRQGELKETLATIFRERTAEGWFALLCSKDCCVAPVRTVAEAAQLMQLDPGRIAAAAGISPAAWPVRSAPELGEHTADILVSLGYDNSEVEEFKRRGAIG